MKMKVVPNQQLLRAIQCPICHSAMSLRAGMDGTAASLVCSGVKCHCYDMAASGYVNLALSGHSNGGDSKDAVRARREFLNLGYYAPAADALAETVRRYTDPKEGIVIDAGCGEGYYSERLAKDGYSVAGVDVSRPAVDSAAKRFARGGIEQGFFGVASVYELPFADESASAVINVFAPCAEREFVRVLRPNGILAVMLAGPEHLMGLKKAMYDQVRKNDTRADLPLELTKIDEVRVCFEACVEGSEAVQNLFAMTPYYWRTSQEDGEKLKKLSCLTTTVDMVIAVYQKKPR